MNLIQRFHDFVTGLGVSPKVADPFIAGLVGLVSATLIRWASTGTFAFDLTQLKVLGVVAVLGMVGVAAPPAAGYVQERASSAQPKGGIRAKRR